MIILIGLVTFCAGFIFGGFLIAWAHSAHAFDASPSHALCEQEFLDMQARLKRVIRERDEEIQRLLIGVS